MQSGFFLNVVVGKHPTILQLLASKDQSLPVRRNTCRALNLRLNIVNGIRQLGVIVLPVRGLINICIPPRRQRTEWRVDSFWMLNQKEYNHPQVACVSQQMKKHTFLVWPLHCQQCQRTPPQEWWSFQSKSSQRSAAKDTRLAVREEVHDESGGTRAATSPWDVLDRFNVEVPDVDGLTFLVVWLTECWYLCIHKIFDCSRSIRTGTKMFP